MSTLHHDSTISDRHDKKPHMVLDYNATKAGVDTLDQLVSTYTSKRKTNRWPMIIFYNMLDISAYNAFVLWTSINPDWNKNKLTKRRLFLEELGKSLVAPLITSRRSMPKTEEALKMVKKYQGISQSQTPSSSVSSVAVVKRARCKFCSSKNDNKTNIVCGKCSKHICKEHATYYCPNCRP